MRACILLLLLTASAAADSYDYPEDNPWHERHPEVAGSIGYRTEQLAGHAIHGPLAELALAVRGPRNTTELSYGFGILPEGATHQVGLRRRLALAAIGGYPDSLRRWDAWVEAGVGAEWFAWTDAARIFRPTFSIGFGADVDSGNDYSYDSSALHWIGARLAVRLTAARPPAEEEVSALCTEGCEPRREHLLDLGIVVSASVLVGR